MKFKTYLSYAILLSSALLSGCASTSAPSPDQVNAAPVPSLKVTLNCGACQVRQNVPELIVAGYKQAAAKAGVSVSSTEQADVTITGYVDRSDAARFMAGAFAGKDEIQAVVTTQDKKITVEDYYRNAWLGIESLAGKIGEMIFTEVRK